LNLQDIESKGDDLQDIQNAGVMVFWSFGETQA
jgi:hypothetical protein